MEYYPIHCLHRLDCVQSEPVIILMLLYDSPQAVLHSWPNFLRYVSSICCMTYDNLMRMAMRISSPPSGRCQWLCVYLGMHNSLGQFFQCFTAHWHDAKRNPTTVHV